MGMNIHEFANCLNKFEIRWFVNIEKKRFSIYPPGSTLWPKPMIMSFASVENMGTNDVDELVTRLKLEEWWG